MLLLLFVVDVNNVPSGVEVPAPPKSAFDEADPTALHSRPIMLFEFMSFEFDEPFNEIILDDDCWHLRRKPRGLRRNEPSSNMNSQFGSMVQ